MNEQIRIVLVGKFPDVPGLVKKIAKSAGINVLIKEITGLKEFLDEQSEYKGAVVLIPYPYDEVDSQEIKNIIRLVSASNHIILLTDRNYESDALELVRLGVEDYIFHGEMQRLISVLVRAGRNRDLQSELERMHESLEMTGNFNRLVGRISRELICLLDQNGYIQSVNPAFEKLSGARSEALKGRNIFSFIHPDDSQQVINLFHEAMIKSSSFSAKFCLMNSSSGKWNDYEASGDWVAGRKSSPGKFVMVLRDISREAEAEKEIKIARLNLQDAARQRSGFLSAVSHEIRTPLNVILGYTSMLKDIHSEQPEVNFQYYNNIERASKRLLNIITQILDMSKIETGEFHISLEPISLNFAVKSAAEMSKSHAKEKNLKIELRMPESDIYVLADEYCLNGIITNLLNNAIKYSDNGIIYIGINKDRNTARMTIEDEGIGINEDYITQLFQPFSQEDYSTTRKFEGAGLGLALTKSYVDLMKGNIEVKSQKDKGTSFTVILPVARHLSQVKKTSDDR